MDTHGHRSWTNAKAFIFNTFNLWDHIWAERDDYDEIVFRPAEQGHKMWRLTTLWSLCRSSRNQRPTTIPGGLGPNRAQGAFHLHGRASPRFLT